ncbi:hypothetical protein SAMN05421678_10576 [Actinopolymorpha cephalotaxi]|uniref:Uncharacterized protein n=1 Tax=Actinopolymorpha cephalotaxi TaxID=504797 RepID=A0A1I2QRX2_9ACTN|nr:hypothetical protein SAMN05421678_10576 [Actinopolymorpha cephalotaxi]
MLRDLLADTRWWDRTRAFGAALRTSTRTPGGLLLVGPPAAEPWHLTAHLDDEARYAQLPELSPTLVRWNPPPDAPRHLSVGLDRLAAARRGESLLVVAESAPESLLERVQDVRRAGATIFAIDTGRTELAGLAHEILSVDSTITDTGPVDDGTFGFPPDGDAAGANSESAWKSPIGAPVSFDSAQHLLSIAAAESASGTRGSGGPRGTGAGSADAGGMRSRLARLLDLISGPSS